MSTARSQDEVIAHWPFHAGSEAKDASSHGYDLELRGEARFVPGGREGSCLESREAHSGNDVAVGAWVLIGLDAAHAEEFNVTLHERDFYASPVTVGEAVTAPWRVEDAHIVTRGR